MIISSKTNTLYKILRKLEKKKERIERGLFIAEGERLVRDAYETNSISRLVISASYFGWTPPDIEAAILSDALFESIAQTQSTQGILAICKIPKVTKGLEDSSKFVVICDGISDPGNLGTIIRTSEAAGVDNIILMPNCTDPFNPKTVRASMGSIFRLPLYESASLDCLIEQDFKILLTALEDDSVDIYDVHAYEKIAVILGNEAHGASEEARNIANLSVKIPMQGKNESLNVAAAAAVVLFEIMRKRRGTNA